MLTTSSIFYLICIILLVYEVTLINSEWNVDDAPNSIDTSLLKKKLILRKINELPSSLPPCNDDELMVFLAQIRAINPESIINLSTEEDLSTMCTQVSDTLDKIDEFLRTCVIQNQKDLYIQLIKGVDCLWDYLCNTTSTRMAFLRYYPCYHNLHDEYTDCHGPADWTEYSEKKKVCKVYKDIADCFYIKTAKLCGLRAAKFMKKLMVHVIDSIITVRCDVKKNPYVPDPMPESASCYKVHNIFHKSFLCFKGVITQSHTEKKKNNSRLLYDCRTVYQSM